MAKRSEAVAKAWRAIALAIEAVDELAADDVDEHSREVAEEVASHERRHEAELLAAARRMKDGDK